MVKKLTSVFFPDQEVTSVTAIVPEDLAAIIQGHAAAKGVDFSEEAGRLILEGLEADRAKKNSSIT